MLFGFYNSATLVSESRTNQQNVILFIVHVYEQQEGITLISSYKSVKSFKGKLRHGWYTSVQTTLGKQTFKKIDKPRSMNLTWDYFDEFLDEETTCWRLEAFVFLHLAKGSAKRQKKIVKRFLIFAVLYFRFFSAAIYSTCSHIRQRLKIVVNLFESVVSSLGVT